MQASLASALCLHCLGLCGLICVCIVWVWVCIVCICPIEGGLDYIMYMGLNCLEVVLSCRIDRDACSKLTTKSSNFSLENIPRNAPTDLDLTHFICGC